MEAVPNCGLPAIPYLHIFPQRAIAATWHVTQDTVEEQRLTLLARTYLDGRKQ